MDERIDFTRLERSGPPANLWPAIAGELDRRRRRSHVRRLSAVAAALLLVVLAVAVTRLPQPPVDGQSAFVDNAELGELQSRSARLESRLAAYRDGLVESDSLQSLIWLEVELGWLDSQLADSPDDIDLWRQRVDLLEALYRRYAREHWGNEMFLASI